MKNITNYKVVEGKETEFVDFITHYLFKQGFGVLSKSEIDLLFFASILKFDDTLGKSDYELSKYFQISQARIRALKEKLSVKYEVIDLPTAIDHFQEKLEFARIDEPFIEIPINDIAVRNALVSLLDENNILIKSELNPKNFKLRIEDLFELLLVFERKLSKKTNAPSNEDLIKSFALSLGQRSDLLEKLKINDFSEKDGYLKILKDGLKKVPVSMGIEFIAGLIPGGYLVSAPVKLILHRLSSKI
jgi:hypothetical protein